MENDTKLNSVAKELYDLISTRFTDLKLGDETANVVTEPDYARFFDFTYSGNGVKLGKISISVDDSAITVIFNKDLMSNQPEGTKQGWYSFLRKIRKIASVNRLTFDVRDITKSNLSKRDYQVISNEKFKGTTMAESKFYGTSNRSYLNMGEARIVIKHSKPVNLENAVSRTQNIESIYIESSSGERYKYPYKHLSGAKAMARHVSEGGNQYDDFGVHIMSLSEELSKLGKFKRYMGRGGVMAESLASYVDAVNERADEIRNKLSKLQRETFYKESFETFEKSDLVEVPEDIAENWVDQLTIKQFNEELKDVFPYIYRIVSEKTKAEVLGPDDIISEIEDRTQTDLDNASAMMPKHKELQNRHVDAANNALKKGDRDLAEKHKEAARLHGRAESKLGWGIKDAAEYSKQAIELTKQLGLPPMSDVAEDNDPCWDNYKQIGMKKKGNREVPNCVPREEIELEAAFDRLMGQFADNPVEEGIKDKLKVLALIGLAGMGGNMALDSISAKNSPLGKALAVAAQQGDEDAEYHLKHLDSYIDGRDTQALKLLRHKYLGDEQFEESDIEDDMEECPCDDNPMPAEPEQKPMPSLSDFILSFYDKNTGQFPKGETSVLTMVEKDYGDKYVPMATEFINRLHGVYEKHTQEQPYLERMKRLAGI
jgi:hypothetical protein